MGGPGQPLRILHVFRSPVGGLFRHVLDVVRGQAARGHSVGIICDSLTGSERGARLLDAATGHLALGLSRIPMPRQPGLSDIAAIRMIRHQMAQQHPDVLHGHGAKGGAYARLAIGKKGPLRVYTPHGGSLHYRPNTLPGLIYAGLERFMQRRTDLFLFESDYIAKIYRETAGNPSAMQRVVSNGVAEDEFVPVPAAADATDFLYIGELRHLKGVDLLITALARLHAAGQTFSATIVGAGDAQAELVAQTRSAGLSGQVRFLAPIPAREAFARGRIMVVPSRSESLPYIVLEAAAAGKPMIATRVGGIPDLFGPYADRLVVPDDPSALAESLSAAINHHERMRDDARLLQDRVRTTFSLDKMVDGGLAAYRAAIAACKS